MFYFRPFPTISYRIPKETKSIAVTNITKRFALTNFVNNAKVMMDEYFIQEGDRPDTIAYEYYNDQTLDWIILLTNEIHDPYFQWPLTDEKFKSFIAQKYDDLARQNNTSALAYAYSTVHHYEQILTSHSVINDNGIQRIVPNKSLVVDYDTYVSLVADERRQVSIYDFEFERNENNKHIYLLDPNYILLIKEQHPYIFDEGNYIR